MLIFRVRPRPFDFCSAERRVSVVVEGKFAVGIRACFDVDGGVAGAGYVIAVEAAFELALTEGGERGWG